MEFVHIPVLLEECIDGLDINPDGIYVDGTAGGAGHSSAIVSRLSDKGQLIAFDRDPDAVKVASDRLSPYKNSCPFLLIPPKLKWSIAKQNLPHYDHPFRQPPQTN